MLSTLVSRSWDATLKRKVIVLKELEAKLEVIKTIKELDAAAIEAQLAKEEHIFNHPSLVNHLNSLPKIEGNWPLVLLRHAEIISIVRKLGINLTKIQNLVDYTRAKEGITLQSDVEDIFANGKLASINLWLECIFKLHQDSLNETQKEQWNASSHHDSRLASIFPNGISSMVYEISLDGRIPACLLEGSMLASEDGSILKNFHSGFVYGSVNYDQRLIGLPVGDNIFLHYFPQDCSSFIKNLIALNDPLFSTKLMRFTANLILEELTKQGIAVVFNKSIDLNQYRLNLTHALEVLSINIDYLAAYYPRTKQWVIDTLGKNIYNPDDLSQLGSQNSILALFDRITKVNYLDSTISQDEMKLIGNEVDIGNQVIFWNAKQTPGSLDPFVGTKGGHTGVLKNAHSTESAVVLEHINANRDLPFYEGLFLSRTVAEFNRAVYSIFEFK